MLVIFREDGNDDFDNESENMQPRILLAFLLTAAMQTAYAEDAPRSVDLPALIECRASHADFVALAPLLEDPLKAIAAGWQPLPQANMFMSEFRLLRPVRVFGREADRIAFTGTGVVAVFDLADPRPLAKELGLDTAYDTPEKFMSGKEVRSDDVARADGRKIIDSAVVSVSNVGSHPGKTLAGCSYSQELLEEPEAPAAPAGETAPAPAQKTG